MSTHQVGPSTVRGDTGPERGSATAISGEAACRVTAPHWFEVSVLGLVVTLATVGSAGLLLAVNGVYSTLAALAIGLPLAVAGVVMLHRKVPRGPTSRAAHLGATAAVLIAVGYAVLVAVTPSQNVVVTRDPGSYVTTAVQLSRTGALQIDARGDAFADVPGLVYTSAATYDAGNSDAGADAAPGQSDQTGIIEPQFNHLASVAMAVAFDVGGYRLLFRLPALMAALGLLALYAVTARVIKRPYLSLVAPTLLAASMPLLFVARNTYSETFTLALLWGAVLVLSGLHRRPSVGVGIVGGVLLGALVCVRVDALLYVGMVFPLAAVSIGAPSTDALRRARIYSWLAVLAATAAIGAIGWWDLTARTGNYARDLGAQISLLRLALVASAVLSLVGLAAWLFLPALRRLGRRLSAPVAAVATVGLGLLLVFAWFVRPHVQTVVGTFSSPTVQNIQRVLGQPIQPTRTYAEYGFTQMAWYLGAPAVVAAIVGLMWGTWCALRGRINPAGLAALALCLGGGALYWYDPQISPDQLWASRRFIPAVFPSLALWATVTVAVVASGSIVRRMRPAARAVIGTVLVAAIVVPAAVTTAPLVWQRVQPGFLKPITEACADVGPDAAVIVVGKASGYALPQSLRSWCDVPVAAQGSALSSVDVAAVADRIRANGYLPFLVSADVNDLKPYITPGGPQPTATSTAISLFEHEQTLDSAPSNYVNPKTVVPFQLFVLAPPTG